MKHIPFLLISIFFFSFYPLSAFASSSITCESRGNNYHFCPAPIQNRSDVRFIQKISKATCYEGSTWGVRRGGIWVNHGCRAVFAVNHGNHYSGYNGGHKHDHSNGYHGGHGNWWDHSSRPSRQPERIPNSHNPKPDRCPAGAWPGRCTQKQRRRGCQDFRTQSGLGCMTFK